MFRCCSPVYTSVLLPGTFSGRRRMTSRASSSWSWRCPGTTRSGTASPSSTPLLFLGTGGCTQSRKLHTCRRLNIIRSSHSMHPFHPWTGVKEVFADIEILYLGSGVQTGGQINPDCGMRWWSHCPLAYIAILPILYLDSVLVDACTLIEECAHIVLLAPSQTGSPLLILEPQLQTDWKRFAYLC